MIEHAYLRIIGSVAHVSDSLTSVLILALLVSFAYPTKTTNSEAGTCVMATRVRSPIIKCTHSMAHMDDTVKHGSLTCIGRPPSSRRFPPHPREITEAEAGRRPLFPAPIQWIDPLCFSPLYRETRHRSLRFLPRPKSSHMVRLWRRLRRPPRRPTRVSPSVSEPRTCGG
jgi:hypothetical protein